MAAVEETHQKRTYGNWRKPVSAGILGLGTAGTVLLFAGLIVVIITVMLTNLLYAVVVAAVLGAVVLAVSTRDVHGRNALDKIIAGAGWRMGRSRGSHLYRSGPLGRTPWGTCQLPGIAAGTRLSEFEDSYGRPCAMVYSPTGQTYATVIATEPDGASLVDEPQIDQWVADWGHWLANLADEPGIEGVAVTIETAPDFGARLRREVQGNIDPEAPAFAQEMLREVVQAYPEGSSTVKAYVTLTFSSAARVGGKRRKEDEMARELAARLPNLTRDLQATGAGAAQPVSAQELCEVIRTAYDPRAAILFDEAAVKGEVMDLEWTEVGPAAAEATWDGYRHENAYSVTWEMSQPPRGHVQAHILTRLLAPHNDVARKRVTMLYRPIDSARAAGIVEADMRSAEFRMSATEKPSARDVMAYRAAQATANEEAAGAGLVQFGMLVTATVEDLDMARDAAATIENLGAAARLRLRRVYGSQDSAFAAALPLGLIPSKHLSAPQEMMTKL